MNAQQRSCSRPRIVSSVLCLALVALSAGCGGGGGAGSAPPPPPPPAPAVSSLSPTSVTAGSGAFTLTVNGANFSTTSTVQWNGSPRTTTFVSSTQLTAAITASDVATGGTIQVTVIGAGGMSSAVVTFTVNNPVPSISSISPVSLVVGAAAFTLTVRGANFVSASVVQWNGQSRPTTFASSTELSASISSADVASAGSVQITVENPPPGGGPSAAAQFSVFPVVGQISSLLETTDGRPPNGVALTYAAISANGRYVAIVSRAGNLAPGSDNGFTDVFLRDTCIEAPMGCVPRTTTLSVAPDGSPGDRDDILIIPAISADGRYVAFNSSSTNLVAGDTNGEQDVFLRDTCVGAQNCTPSTIRVSVTNDGSQAVSPPSPVLTGSFHPAVSADGRLVAFASVASNLVPGVVNPNPSFPLVYLRDTCLGALGCTPSTTLVSVTNAGQVLGGLLPAISADGRFVFYVGGLVRDTCFGASACTPSTSQLSIANGGVPPDASWQSHRVAISGDGRFVAFNHDATNLVSGDTNGQTDVFVHDRDTDADGILDEPGTVQTSRASVSTSGTEGNDRSFEAWLTPDGRFVGFHSDASALIPNDTNGRRDIFVLDTCVGATGCSQELRRISLAADGTEITTNARAVSLSADGRFASYATVAVTNPNFVVDDILLARTGFDPVLAAPQATVLSPPNVAAGSPGLTLAVFGSGFSPRSVVRWNGSDRITMFVSASKLLV